MVSDKQRRRALARAKYERQQAKRTAEQRRNRMIQRVAGSVVAIVAVVLVGWGVVHLVGNNDNSTPPTTTPNTTTSSVTPTAPVTLPNGSTLPPNTLTQPTSSGTTAITLNTNPTTGSGAATNGATHSPTAPVNTGTAGGGGQ